MNSAFIIVRRIPRWVGLIGLTCLLLAPVKLPGQDTNWMLDAFDSSGGVSNWGNWFGDAFQSLSWDPTVNQGGNPGSGSMKVVSRFTLGDHGQTEVYNGFFTMSVDARQWTNLQLDIRFAADSVVRTNTNGKLDFGYMQVGTWASNYTQDYFYHFAVKATNNAGRPNTNWTHLSMVLDPTTDSNLTNITDLLFHSLNTWYGNTYNGTQTYWIDNIQFFGFSNPPPSVAQCTVDWTNVHQRIDGFGASSAWHSSLTEAQADMFFSTNSGIGLSLLRTRIAPNGTTVEESVMQQAQARGARIWSTPWSPPAIYKDTNSVNGGHFVSSAANCQGYADQLAGYVANVKRLYGVNLYAISVQNEPNISTSYESCLWSGQQIHDFLPYLSAALKASNVASTKIMIPEPSGWNFKLATNTLDDPATSNLVGILAAHAYGGSPAPENYGLPLWETEVSDGKHPFDPSMTDGIKWAKMIHDYLTIAQVNTWHYWWLTTRGTNNSALTGPSGNPAKRMYVLGNYSRFVRPGYYRIGTSNRGATLVSAYQNPSNGWFALIAINPSSITVTQDFAFNGFTASGITPWVTSSNLSLAAQPPMPAEGTTFSYPLPPMSVVTFVGQADASLPPALHVAVESGAAIFSWPANAPGFVLETSPDLTSSNWTTVPTAPAYQNGDYVLTNSISGQTRFYRLRKN